jgi:hypothetical protein
MPARKDVLPPRPPARLDLATLEPPAAGPAWIARAMFAMEASDEQEARAIAGRVLDQMNVADAISEIQAAPIPEGLWSVNADLDLAGEQFEPDDAETRLSYLTDHLGGVTWVGVVRDRQAGKSWPPDIWSRQPGRDDVLVHPAIRAAKIWVTAKERT